LPNLLENVEEIQIGLTPIAVPVRKIRSILRRFQRVEVSVPAGTDGYALLFRVSKLELLRTLRRAAKRGCTTVDVSDLFGVLCVGGL
jgi:hypothetical protein